MRRVLYKYFKVLLIAIAVFFALSNLSFAGITVTPERHVLELSPGEERAVDYKIYNAGEEDIHISIDVSEWSKSAENKDININSWLFVENKEFDVKVGDTKALNIKVKAPDKATGEILAMVFLCYKEKKDSTLNLRYGNPLYLVIKGTERYDAKINKIDCTYSKDPARGNRSYLQVSVNITNTGNIHIKPDITANIVDKDNNILNQLEIKDGYPIFPAQSYAYTLQWWDAELQDGIYKAKVTTAYKDKIKLSEQVTEFEVNKGELAPITKAK